jgi:hypothetical protein
MIPFPWRLAAYVSTATTMLITFESTHSEWAEFGIGAVVFVAAPSIYLRRARSVRRSGQTDNATGSSRDPFWAKVLWGVIALGVFSLPTFGWGGTKAFLALSLIAGWTEASILVHRVRPPRPALGREADRQAREDNYRYWHRIEFKRRQP